MKANLKRGETGTENVRVLNNNQRISQSSVKVHKILYTKQDCLRNKKPFTLPQNYEIYVKRTNEKIILQNEIARAYYMNELPIRPGEFNKKVLDLGCGLGTNTAALISLFETHDVYALDISKDFINIASEFLIAPNNNLCFIHKAFEDFDKLKFDFILCSHTLQYIDTPLIPFLKKIFEHLTHNGEAWIILQEEHGINQIVRESIPFLNKKSPHFNDWFVHCYVRELLLDLGVKIRAQTFLSYFFAPNMDDLNNGDINLLNFFLLDGFEINNIELRNTLKNLIEHQSIKGFIPHEVGITKFRKI